MNELINYNYPVSDIIWSTNELKQIKTKTQLQKFLLSCWPNAILNLSTVTMRDVISGMEFYTGWTTEFITVPNFKIPKNIQLTYYTPYLNHRGFRITFSSGSTIRYPIYYHDNTASDSSINGMFLNGKYDGSPSYYGYKKDANAATGYRGTVIWDSTNLIKNDSFYLNNNISMSMMFGYNDRTPGGFIIEKMIFNY